MAKAKGGNPQKKSAGRKRKVDAANQDGEHVRQLAPASAVKSFINSVISTRNATSECGQELSTATRKANDQGVNVPAARIAARILSKARQDSLKARVLWEDTVFYLLECTDFNRIAPEGLFSAGEAGQKHSRKPKQQELAIETTEGGGVSYETVPETDDETVVTH